MTRQCAILAVARLLLATLVLLTAPAFAQNHIKASLIAESPAPVSGGTTTIALLMQPEKGWHGYWQNPGDAGVEARLDWTLPKGVTVSPPRYPVPERLVISELMNHVFNGEHALIMRLAVPRGLGVGTRLPLRLKADWLACTDRICVPEQGEMTLDLVVGDGRIVPASQAQFDGWRGKLPQPIGGATVFETDSKTIRIGIPYPAAAEAQDPWFFASTLDVIKYAQPQKVSRAGDMLVIETGLTGKPPTEIAGVLSIGKGRGLEIVARPGGLPGGEASAASGLIPTLLALGGAILGGLLLNIMPCVFPIVSLKALSLARAGGDEHAAKADALAYTAGVVLTCVALGGLLLGLRAAGNTVGWAFQLQDWRIVLLLLLLAIAITLNLLGLFTLPGFGGGERLAGQGGRAGAFWTGALAAFVATPCTGPFMAAALGAALVLPAPAALAIFAGLGIGLALPFLAIGYVPSLRTRLPKPGKWMETFRRWMALPMALTALALAWLLWQQTVGNAAGPDAGSRGAHAEIAFSESSLKDLQTNGRPVFLYFTADWCLTCKVNESAAIERDAVRVAFKKANVAVMVGDWTNGDPAITRFLEAHGRSGVPLYLFYSGGKDAAGALPKTLPQVLTPSILVDLAKGS